MMAKLTEKVKRMIEGIGDQDVRVDADLLPCPFCGSDDACIVRDSILNAYQPGCAHCGVNLGHYTSKRAAANTWNMRDPSPQDVQKLRDKISDLQQQLAMSQPNQQN